MGNPSVTVLALHGFTGSGRDFDPIRQELADHWPQWICPDLPGHGSNSDCEREAYSLESTLDQIHAARMSADDPDKVILLGYSMGARIGLHYLTRYPVKRAIFIGGSPGLHQASERCDRVLQDQKWIDQLMAIHPDIEAFCDEWESQPIIQPHSRLPEPVLSELRRRRRSNNPAGLALSLSQCGTGVLPSLWDKLGDLPALDLLHGEWDLKFKKIAHAMQEKNPSFAITAVAGCGHAPHFENPALTGNILRSLN